MRDRDEESPSSPTVRGWGAWWYVAVLAVLLAAGILGAILFFGGDDDGDGYLWNRTGPPAEVSVPND